ncbi:MAG: chemotaxis-specific protein-glutamate methyltransferase CheB [Myxococcales bacterium]|nr:chemotaxis-specific protein-glutamate methyltransferase CheB [Myxococcales bacterium]
MRTLRAIVVDDSAYNRRTISDLLEEIDGVTVVGKAVDGNDALRLVTELEPDLVTLDLEMPRMDGYTFLRLLMARRPTPVIVVSGYANKENVFKALELGAVDFIAKPARMVTADLASIRGELQRVVNVVKKLSPQSLAQPRAKVRTDSTRAPTQKVPRGGAPQHVVAIGASTGGPSALVEVFRHFPPTLKGAVVVAQHMPERFTTTFAERLDRVSGLSVVEASGRTELVAGMALVCPGGKCLEVRREGDRLFAEVVAPNPDDRYIPSVDRLFESVAKAMGLRSIGVVLTGMGDDGAKGAQALKDRQARVFIESPETAVIYGMPGAVERVGAFDEILPLRLVGARVCEEVGVDSSGEPSA